MKPSLNETCLPIIGIRSLTLLILVGLVKRYMMKFLRSLLYVEVTISIDVWRFSRWIAKKELHARAANYNKVYSKYSGVWYPLIWILNGRKEAGFQMVRISNGIWNPEAQPAVYFDQWMGASQAVRWSTSSLLAFKHRKTCFKFEKFGRNIQHRPFGIWTNGPPFCQKTIWKPDNTVQI